MRFNVIIATHKRKELVERTLASIAQAHLPDCLESVCVMENGSDDGTRAVCERFTDSARVAYRHYPKPGKSAAYNSELERIGEGFVLFLDDDVRVAPGMFDAYAEAAAEHGPDAVYGGPIECEYVQPPPQWLVQYLPRSAVGWEPENPKTFSEWFLGPNYGAFCERILEVGAYDPTMGPGTFCHLGDEMDLQRRLFEVGCHKAYVPQAKVWHYVPTERCDMKYALHRRYLESLANTLEDDVDMNVPMWRDAPRWLWRKLAMARLSDLAANLVPDAHTRYKMRKPLYRWRGYLKALRVRAARGK